MNLSSKTVCDKIALKLQFDKISDNLSFNSHVIYNMLHVV